MKRLSFSNKVPVGTVFVSRASWSDASSLSSANASVFFAEEFAGITLPPYAFTTSQAFRSVKACNAAKGQSDVTAAARVACERVAAYEKAGFGDLVFS
jgi:hypothetical protein